MINFVAEKAVRINKYASAKSTPFQRKNKVDARLAQLLERWLKLASTLVQCPLPAGTDYIMLFIFLLAHQLPPFKRVKEKTGDQSARFENS